MRDHSTTWHPVEGYPGLFERNGTYSFWAGGRGKRKQIICQVDGVKITKPDLANVFRLTFLGKAESERVIPRNVTVQAYFEQWIAQARKRPRTITTYRERFRLYAEPLHDRKLHEVGVADIRKLVASLREAGRAEWTIHGTLTVLSAMFAVAKEDRLVSLNPVRELVTGRPQPLKRNAEKRLVSPAELEQLLGASPEWLQPILLTLAYTGMRISEVLGLTWDKLDFNAQTILVNRQLGPEGDLVPLKGQGGKEARRVLDLPVNLAAVLKPRRQLGGFVFATSTGSAYSAQNVSRAFCKARREVGLGEDLTFHSFRHTVASLLIARGADVARVQAQLGHSSPTTTLEVYTHEFEEARSRGENGSLLQAFFGQVGL